MALVSAAAPTGPARADDFAQALRDLVVSFPAGEEQPPRPAPGCQHQAQAEQQPGAVLLSVRDNGLELTPVQQQRLFQVFQRLHTHAKGTGVGLYMSKRLVDSAGAHIAVASAPGVGTTFYRHVSYRARTALTADLPHTVFSEPSQVYLLRPQAVRPTSTTSARAV